LGLKGTPWWTVARAVLFAAGVGLAVWLIRGVGFGRVLEVLTENWRWIPLVLLLEVLFVSTDIVALRFLYGDASRQIAPTVWVRSTAVAYASQILLPAGRAAGEAGRAATLAPSVGAADSVAVSTRLQACYLLGNAGISSIIVTVLLAQGGWGASLWPLLLGNAGVCAALGTGLLLLLASGRVAEWIKRRLRRFETGKDPGELRPGARQVVLAVASCVLGRLFQTAEYGVALHAVGGHATPVTAFATQGTLLVGAAIGDLVPGQVGATEGAFRAFAETLGLGADPARALSIALMGRVAQISLAVTCVVVAVLVPRRPARPPREEG
jgi:Lysylphosphatidylglycerol synthase TM region